MHRAIREDPLTESEIFFDLTHPPWRPSGDEENLDAHLIGTVKCFYCSRRYRAIVSNDGPVEISSNQLRALKQWVQTSPYQEVGQVLEALSLSHLSSDDSQESQQSFEEWPQVCR